MLWLLPLGVLLTLARTYDATDLPNRRPLALNSGGFGRQHVDRAPFDAPMAAWRPKRISRVFAGCNASSNARILSCRSRKKAFASCSCWKPTMEFRIADDNHVAGRLGPAPAMGPQIERVVQVDVRQN